MRAHAFPLSRAARAQGVLGAVARPAQASAVGGDPGYHVPLPEPQARLPQSQMSKLFKFEATVHVCLLALPPAPSYSFSDVF